MKTEYIYLLHFSKPLKQSRHYIGSTAFLNGRINHHRKGRGGVKIINAANREGIRLTLARVWKGDKTVERKIKNWKMAPKLCPICRMIKRVGQVKTWVQVSNEQFNRVHIEPIHIYFRHKGDKP